MILMLEVGNSIDGITIAAKVLNVLKDSNKYQFENPTPTTKVDTNFSTYNNWKKRKCHCCMECILDTKEALICANIIKI